MSDDIELLPGQADVLDLLTGSVTIVVPAPCGWINTNVRMHRMAKANLTKQWRAAACVAARGLEPMATPVRIVAHIWKARNGRYDPNNLADTTKAIVDGLVDSGLLEDDSFKHVIGPDHRHGGKGEPRIILTITQGETP
ncbi:hypothetical protein [Paeniglutamicibacter terrestris]|uniref:Uncharacterized protein n=1 Tax=Paeniglutamicibacter terrestris TaxID=2723403 RepID=A0ABX1G9H9_9MICC|nr:hypothetical protein [Paeniglutamicibacter terrestris]NKG22226.1 hypothetical protein [Paeniglutamicibacter terrestris]